MFEAKSFQGRVSIDDLFGLLGLALELCLVRVLLIVLLLAQVVQGPIDAPFEAGATLVRLCLDDLSHLVPLFYLSVQEAVQVLNLDPTLLHVDYPKVVLHVLARFAMAHEDFTEDRVDAEELFFKLAAHIPTVFLNDVPSPHADNFPLLEVSEEVF